MKPASASLFLFLPYIKRMLKVKNKKVVFVALSCVLIFLMLISCMMGAANLEFKKVFLVIFDQFPLINKWIPEGSYDSAEYMIVWRLRLPRIVLSVLAGSALAVCGGAYQSVFRNPLTDPYILGISSGASLGAAIAILLGWESYLLGIGFSALVTALLTVFLIFRISSIGNRLHTSTLLLTGVCFNFLISAIISFILVLRKDKMDKIIFWTMGSLSSVSWMDVLIVLPFIVAGILVVLYYSKDLNILLLGSETAQSLGVQVEKVKKILLFFTTLMVAFVVSTCGVIGFVGLIVPHIVRIILGSDNRVVIPFSVFVGAVFMLFADTFARTVLQPAELPVGSITALIGAPFFIYLLYQAKQKI